MFAYFLLFSVSQFADCFVSLRTFSIFPHAFCRFRNLRIMDELVLGWVTMSGVQLPVWYNLSQYITSHPGQLSLAIPPRVGAMSTSERAVMPCGWVVKAGIVREWVAGKTVWSPCFHGPYLSTSAKLLQPSGTICRSVHTLLRHTNDSDLRQRNISMNWLLQTDHVTVSAPTISFFF